MMDLWMGSKNVEVHKSLIDLFIVLNLVDVPNVVKIQIMLFLNNKMLNDISMLGGWMDV
jgi:hypothetical protein